MKRRTLNVIGLSVAAAIWGVPVLFAAATITAWAWRWMLVTLLSQ